MADIEFDAVDYDESVGLPPIVGTLTMWAGGVLSLALVAGLALWGYRITVRDMTGVPVVQALEGPIRIAPEDPGGQLAPHQGLAVNRIAAEGEAAPPPEALYLAPTPVALTDEDRPRAELRPPMAPVAAGGDSADQPQAPIAAPAALVMDGAENGDLALADPAAADRAQPEPVRALPPGAVARSPRPAPRPGVDLVARAALATTSVAMAPAKADEMAPDEIIAGTVLVQLGAFDSAEEARSVWGRLNGAGGFADFFDEKLRVVQQAESGGRVFYRLRAAGFGDMADARRFCAALMAEGADCIPVVAR